MSPIRPATLLDLELIFRIEEQSYPSPWSYEFLVEELCNSVTSAYVMDHAEQVIGYIFFHVQEGTHKTSELSLRAEWRVFREQRVRPPDDLGDVPCADGFECGNGCSYRNMPSPNGLQPIDVRADSEIPASVDGSLQFIKLRVLPGLGLPIDLINANGRVHRQESVAIGANELRRGAGQLVRELPNY